MVIGSQLKAYFRNSAAFSRLMGHVSSQNGVMSPNVIEKHLKAQN